MSKYSHLFSEEYLYGIRDQDGKLNWCSDDNRFIKDMYDNEDLSWDDSFSNHYILEKIVSLDEKANVTVIFNRERDFNPMPELRNGDIVKVSNISGNIYYGIVIIDEIHQRIVYPNSWDDILKARSINNDHGIVAVYRGKNIYSINPPLYINCIWHNEFDEEEEETE